MRGKGSDQGGHWPVGIWFAMVGVSAGTVAAFSLIGWTFAKDLYGGGDGIEPLDYEPQTVVIEAETPDPVGVAGGDGGPLGPGPEPRIAISPAAEPQAERIGEADDAGGAPREPDDGRVPESAPPQLVPVEEEDGPCPPEESGEDETPGGTGDDESPAWPDHWSGDWEDLRDWDAIDLDELGLDIELDLKLDRAVELEAEARSEAESQEQPDVDLDAALDAETRGEVEADRETRNREALVPELELEPLDQQDLGPDTGLAPED
ncbi:hypothetical protein AB0K52_17725 [Glycomyces sp. NPDC049804]|uniref:hypothetical protein n=1 Tax=Glycomyces sp. NPDC049804 TaxID=3154363 RepID=UPI0034430F84